jgi:hypothetical protein
VSSGVEAASCYYVSMITVANIRRNASALAGPAAAHRVVD